MRTSHESTAAKATPQVRLLSPEVPRPRKEADAASPERQSAFSTGSCAEASLSQQETEAAEVGEEAGSSCRSNDTFRSTSPLSTACCRTISLTNAAVAPMGSSRLLVSTAEQPLSGVGNSRPPPCSISLPRPALRQSSDVLDPSPPTPSPCFRVLAAPSSAIPECASPPDFPHKQAFDSTSGRVADCPSTQTVEAGVCHLDAYDYVYLYCVNTPFLECQRRLPAAPALPSGSEACAFTPYGQEAGSTTPVAVTPTPRPAGAGLPAFPLLDVSAFPAVSDTCDSSVSHKCSCALVQPVPKPASSPQPSHPPQHPSDFLLRTEIAHHTPLHTCEQMSAYDIDRNLVLECFALERVGDAYCALVTLASVYGLLPVLLDKKLEEVIYRQILLTAVREFAQDSAPGNADDDATLRPEGSATEAPASPSKIAGNSSLSLLSGRTQSFVINAPVVGLSSSAGTNPSVARSTVQTEPQVGNLPTGNQSDLPSVSRYRRLRSATVDLLLRTVVAIVRKMTVPQYERSSNTFTALDHLPLSPTSTSYITALSPSLSPAESASFKDAKHMLFDYTVGLLLQHYEHSSKARQGCYRSETVISVSSPTTADDRKPSMVAKVLGGTLSPEGKESHRLFSWRSRSSRLSRSSSCDAAKQTACVLSIAREGRAGADSNNSREGFMRSGEEIPWQVVIKDEPRLLVLSKHTVVPISGDQGQQSVAPAEVRDKKGKVSKKEKAAAKQDSKRSGVPAADGPLTTVLWFRVEGLVESPILAVLSVLNELDLFKQWIPYFRFPFKLGLRESYKLYDLGRVDQIGMFKVDFPWPMQNRECIVNIWSADMLEEDNTIVIMITACEPKDIYRRYAVHIPPVEHDHVRIYVEGFMAITALSSSTCRTTFFWRINPMVNAPTAILDFVTKVFAKSAYNSFRSACEGAKGPKSAYSARRENNPFLYKFVMDRLIDIHGSSLLLAPAEEMTAQTKKSKKDGKIANAKGGKRRG